MGWLWVVCGLFVSVWGEKGREGGGDGGEEEVVAVVAVVVEDTNSGRARVYVHMNTTITEIRLQVAITRAHHLRDELPKNLPMLKATTRRHIHRRHPSTRNSSPGSNPISSCTHQSTHRGNELEKQSGTVTSQST